MIKENAKPIPLDMSVKIPKMKGHTTIILKNEKTGEIERHEDDNYMTNAIAEYFANCGFMNYPNIDRANMVQLLLGGIMAFDEPISEDNDDPTIVHVPTGHKMIANGSVGTLNNGEVLEMGSYSSTESGWQADGSYVQTYDFTTSQANGTISCICLTGQAYGYAGEGNSISGVRHANKVNITGLAGSVTSQTGIVGTPFNIDLTDSSCNTFAVETRTDAQTEEEYVTGVLRKYRLPISMINIKGTMSAPILLSETEIAIDADMQSASTTQYFFLNGQPLGKNLILWNAHYAPRPAPVWGENFTQYIWTITPSGTITKETITNTSGVSLSGLQAAHFDGNYCFFTMARGIDQSYGDAGADSRTVYILNRSTGAIASLENPYGKYVGGINWWQNQYYQWDWALISSRGDGKIVVGGNTGCYVVDATNNTIYPSNASGTNYNSQLALVSGLIRSYGVNLYRDQSYIASINNLETPVVKTAEKSMKIIYRITFEEEEPEPSPSPTPVDTYDVEPYFETATRNAVNKINNLGSQWESFAFVTDTHTNWNQLHSADIIREIVSRTGIKAFWAGDTSEVLFGTGAEFDSYASGLTSVRSNVYFALGNHDRVEKENFDLSQVIKCYNAFLAGKTLQGTPSSYYYYFDNTTKKIRYMVINTCEDREDWYVMSAEQLAWITANVQLPDSTWNLVVIGHCDIDTGVAVTSHSKNAQAICDAIATCNGHIVGYFCGHQHIDNVSLVDNTFHQTIMLCDCIDAHEWYPEVYDYPTRTVGTASEQAVTIVHFNTTTGAVEFTRIGAYVSGTLPTYNYLS